MGNSRFKFRAWDKSNQCMVYPGEENTVFTFTNGILCVECLETVWKEGGGETYEKDEFFQVDCEIMQFTGLKDRHGKEIYDGDILTSTLGNGLPCQIKFGEFHDDAERDFDNITFIGFYFHEQTGERTAFGKSIYGNTECFEIIGNIYENPELLK